MAMEEIKAKFVGKWKVDRSENFDDFLKEVGVNFALRKIASLAKPVMDITIEEGDKVKIAMHIGIKDQIDMFKFGEEYEKEMDGNKLKATATFEDGKIKITIYCGDVVCKQIKNKFVGKWKLDRSENFDSFLREIASAASPVVTISIDDDGKIHINTNAGFRTTAEEFKLDEEFEKETEGQKLKLNFIDSISSFLQNK
ncbi:hypothetical protein KUTeg_009785 [Tegillarca granosa]|uniref:Cytosolic fatty-acid binding proteins domain-containing protein n=2 Tax=Tegillarca granosa TaxID=220873 RepID=A0ABQ9F4X4_TEGGR|nr:hypothetical protein KUTeg_009785 [Tegillarca granosa]